MLKNIIVFVALIVAVASAQTVLTPGKTIGASTQFRSWSYFSLQMSESTINYIRFVTTVDSGTPFYYANYGSYPTFTSNIWKSENVTGGSIDKYIYNPNIDLNVGTFSHGVLYFGIYGYTNTKYTITAYTQGPIPLYDRQISIPAYPLPDMLYGVDVFYKFTIDSDLRLFQVVVQPPASTAFTFPFFMSNSTVTYPVSARSAQYSSTNSGITTCISINYPYPGTYRLGISTSGSNYTIQTVENGLGTCKIE